jgi:glycosyltransferase involved in cell wall biosynthesis
LGFATVVGILVRYARRIVGRKPRIWHGFRPIHFLRDMVEMDRRLGYPARSVVSTSKVLEYALMTDQQFDVVLDSAHVPWDQRHWAALTDMLRRADIWVANFDCLFYVWHDRKNDWAMRLLRMVGIRIIVVPHGSDIVQWTPHQDRYGWVERMSRDYPAWNFDEQTLVSRRRVDLFSRFADLVVSGDSSLDPFLPRRDLRFKYFPIDTEKLRPMPAPLREIPLIVHAPNHRLVKGTPELLETLDRLQSRGFAFELRLVERVAHTEAQAIYETADLIADQFIIGAFGSFALEGLALGKPVLAYLDQEHLRDPVFNLPIVNTTLENMERVLAVLLAIPELRRRLGEMGRAAVTRYHSYEAMGEVWDRLYRHAWRKEPLALEDTSHFTRSTRSTIEDPSQPEFWPVDVTDLLPQIHAALARL